MPAAVTKKALVACSPGENDKLVPVFADWGFDVDRVESAEVAAQQLRARHFDVALTAFSPNTDAGPALVQAAKRPEGTTPLVFVIDDGDQEAGVAALKQGAFRYVVRPINQEELRLLVDNALDITQRDRQHRQLLKQLQHQYGPDEIVGHSAVMRPVFDLVTRVADSPASVLLTGESGTGKELIARAIHFRGARSEHPFVAVNCAAIPSTLLESELFGHERGAFTGAHRARPGLFVQAHGGTLFLDEVSDLPLDLQPKLLRALQEGEVRPVGSDRARAVDVRIIAATHADLREEAKRGLFRQDLFYRLSVVPLEVPPLRDRLDDIPLLAERFLERARQSNPRITPSRITPQAVEILMQYHWPGNVRELENVIERAATLCADDALDIPDFLFLEPHLAVSSIDTLFHNQPTLLEVERRYIDQVMKSVNGNRVQAAAILDIDPSTLYRRLKRRA